MNMKRICAIVLALLLMARIVPVVSQGGVPSTYYVATIGDNANPGTIADPFLTIQYAVDQVQPGDSVIVRGGSYTESVALTISGTVGLPITLTAYRSEPVTINGGIDPTLHSRWNGVQWWIIDGLVLDSDHDYVVQFSMWETFWSDYMVIRNNLIRGSVLVGGSYNIFEGNEVDGTDHAYSQGVTEETENSHHNVYRNNHIHDFTHRCVWSMKRTHNSVFEYNEIHDCEYGLDLDGYGNVVWEHTVRENDLYAINEYSVEIENAFATSVISNTIHDSPKRGITIINYGDGNCGTAGLYGDQDADGDCRDELTGNTVNGNVIQNIPGHGAIIVWDTGGLLISGNVIDCGGYAAGILLDCSGFCRQIEIRGNAIQGCGWGAIRFPSVEPALSILVDEVE